MKHRKTTVVMIGVCMLWLALASGAMANEFYAEGQADTIEGAENLGKTIVHYIVTLGFPTVSALLMGGGAIRLRKDVGQGGAAIGSGIGVGWLGQIVNNLHADASAAVFLGPLLGALSWPAVVFQLVLQASLCAAGLCYLRGRFQCGNAAAVSLTSR